MLQPNGIRFHCHDPLDRKTFGSHCITIHDLLDSQSVYSGMSVDRKTLFFS
jgi:hypothetical protein